MLQNQRLRMIDGEIAAEAGIAEGFRVMRTLREEQWRRLGRQVDHIGDRRRFGGCGA